MTTAVPPAGSSQAEFLRVSNVKVPNAATQVEYLTAACKMLDGLDAVERYSWFALPQSDVQPPTNLFDKTGTITPLGEAYKEV